MFIHALYLYGQMIKQ